jgi:hypothetical protein
MSFGALRSVVGQVLRAGSRDTRQALASRSVTLKGHLVTRSIWSVSNNSFHSRFSGCGSVLTNSTFNKSTQQCVHTAGDKDLIEFLNDEIKLEKGNKKTSGKAPKINGFELTKADGPSVVLTRKIENETITIKFNVNNTIEDSMLGMDEGHQQQQEEQAESEMISKPAFVVEINKGGDKTLAIHCVFPPADEVPPQEQAGQDEHYEDLIEIQDVTLLSKSQEWNEDVYSLSGSVMDGNLYDLLLKLLEERGIDADFLDQLIEWSTSYEHQKYVGLLEQLKDFVASK